MYTSDYRLRSSGWLRWSGWPGSRTRTRWKIDMLLSAAEMRYLLDMARDSGAAPATAFRQIVERHHAARDSDMTARGSPDGPALIRFPIRIDDWTLRQLLDIARGAPDGCHPSDKPPPGSLPHAARTAVSWALAEKPPVPVPDTAKAQAASPTGGGAFSDQLTR